MILSAIFKIGCFILIIFALNLSAADSIIPHAFRISLIGATKIQLTENKSDTKCEVDKKSLKSPVIQTILRQRLGLNLTGVVIRLVI